MKAGTTYHLMSILAYAVVIDKKIYQEEVDAFVEAVLSLENLFPKETNLNRASIRQWFIEHREVLTANIKSSIGSSYILQHITALNSLREKDRIVRAIIAISVSDNYLHFMETKLVDLCSAHWGVTAPIQTVGRQK